MGFFLLAARGGYSVVVQELLIAVASLVERSESETRAQCLGLAGPRASVQQLYHKG